MALWRDKTRGDWRFSFQYQGRTYTGGRYETREKSLDAQQEKKRSVRSAHPETPTDIIFSHLANLYLDASAKRHARKTYEYKRMVYNKFIEHHGDLPVIEITPFRIQEYLNTRPSPHNFNVHRKELSALFEYASRVLRHELGIQAINPVTSIDRLPETRTRKAIPSRKEVIKIMRAAGPETRALLLVVLHTLGRINEVLGLTWEDVDFQKSTVRLWTRKRKDGSLEADILPMNQDLKDILQRLWKKKTQEKWVFLNPETGSRYNRRPKLMRGICRTAGVPFYGFHALRHYAASVLADTPRIGLKTISGLLRHKSLATTEIYLHSIEEAQRKAVKTLEGSFGRGLGRGVRPSKGPKKGMTGKGPS